MPRNRMADTHCRRGHEWTPENTYIDPRGYRQCRTCRGRVGNRPGRRPGEQIISKRQRVQRVAWVDFDRLADLVDNPPEDWRSQAACRGMDTNVFFPRRGESIRARAAMETCRGCPVVLECLAGNLDVDDGIYGATTYLHRRTIRTVLYNRKMFEVAS